jgi:hypothetical protein
MTLEEARAKLEARFKIGPIGNGPIAPTGERYVEIRGGGSPREGEPCPVLCSSEQMAIKQWLLAVEEYAAGKSGTLYWRIVPELGDQEDGSGWQHGPADVWKLYSVYSRLLISDKRVINA